MNHSGKGDLGTSDCNRGLVPLIGGSMQGSENVKAGCLKLKAGSFCERSIAGILNEEGAFVLNGKDSIECLLKGSGKLIVVGGAICPISSVGNEGLRVALMEALANDSDVA
jgi:hypothetical protein